MRLSLCNSIPVIFVIRAITFIGAQDDCSSYTVSVEQAEFLSKEFITFNCSYNSPSASLIRWQQSDNAMTDFQAVFTADPTDPNFSDIVGDYADRVNGTLEIESKRHILTVYNASVYDDCHFWRCIVEIPGCPDAEDIQPTQYASKS